MAGDKFSSADTTARGAVDYAGFVDIAVPDGITNLKRWYQAVSNRPSAAA